jgi:hypothetical protein
MSLSNKIISTDHVGTLIIKEADLKEALETTLIRFLLPYKKMHKKTQKEFKEIWGERLLK